MTNAFYALIQVCPDFARAEAMNVGVVIFDPRAQSCHVRTATDLKPIQAFLRAADLDAAEVRDDVERMQRRIELERWSSVDDFDRFARSRGNLVQVTQPRSVGIESAELQLEQLFSELVSRRPARMASGAGSLRSEALDLVFAELHELHPERAWKDARFRVESLALTIDVDYAYRNGALNLVELKRLPKRADSAERLALECNSRGELVSKHIEPRRSRLTIVAVPGPLAPASEIVERVSRVLTDLGGAEFVAPTAIDAWTHRVRREVLEDHADESV